jgi:homoaconitase/3-isopropylmalate dehydratase large subunit
MEGTAESPTIEANPKRKHYITKENAVALAKNSAIARNRKAAEQARQMAELKEIAEHARQIILAHALEKRVAPAVVPEEVYRLEQLVRVRRQIDNLWKGFETAGNAKDQQAIATAIQKLTDLEFALAKRPKPGALRPVREKPTKNTPSQGPIED